MKSSIIERLIQAVTDTSSVTLQSLGSVEDVSASAQELAADKFAPYVAAAFCSQLQLGQWTEQHSVALQNFASGLGNQRSYLALRETADVLLGDENALKLVATTLHDALLPSEDSIVSRPVLAGLQLEITIEVVAKTTVAPYRLLALLTGPVHNYPEEFEDPLARALRVAADIWTSTEDRERFTTTLNALAQRGNYEATYESAVGVLRDALMQTNKQDLIKRVRKVRDRFVGIAEQGEGREDADAFAHTCTALIAFHEADRKTLSATAQAARNIAERRALLNFRTHSRNQTIARQGAQLAWITLAWQLDTAAEEIEDEAFLDTWVAVDAITKVYEADRQFTNLQVVTSVIRPRIVNEIAQRQAMAHQLERAVAVDKQRDDPVLSRDIYELLDLVYRSRAAPREPADPTEESSHSTPFLKALLGAEAVVIDDLPLSRRRRLEAAARQTFVGIFAGDQPKNDVIDQICADIMSDLSENPSFTGAAKSDFSMLIRHTVRFLVYVGDNSQSYTALIRPGDPIPPESTIQNHFHEFLSATTFAGRVGKEHANIATGRADVILTLDEGRRYVTEVKRERGSASREDLDSSYLAQATEYQSTNLPLGQLLVLDLTEHPSGTPHINDSIWVTHRRDAAGQVTNSTVVAVVRGNRPTPSSMVL